jgi:flagellar biosynthesis/type III secretory pathway protein FliH
MREAKDKIIVLLTHAREEGRKEVMQSDFAQKMYQKGKEEGMRQERETILKTLKTIADKYNNCVT